MWIYIQWFLAIASMQSAASGLLDIFALTKYFGLIIFVMQSPI